MLAEEVAFACREEFAQTLTDIVFRRTMLGLEADQGRPYYPQIARLAAEECGWDASRCSRELGALNDYADRLLQLDEDGNQPPP